MSEDSKEVLIVASKLKKFIKEEAGLNTSSSVIEVLSNRVRKICLDAIQSAQSDGRKTVLDRDIVQQ